MTITEVEAIALSATFADIYGGLDQVPPSVLHPAAHYLTFPRTGQCSTLVKLTASDGTVGVGEAWGLPLPTITATIINEIFRPMLLGQDPRDITALWERIVTWLEGQGHTRGFMMEALSGLDIALWDLRGKREGQAIAALLAERPKTQVECYASPVRFCDTHDESRQQAQAFVAQGFKGIKVKAGRSIDIDAAHIAAIRDAVGPDIRILIDLNCSFDVKTTIDFAKEVEPLGIYWLEEPLPPENTDALCEIRRSINMPLATGEDEFHVNGFRDLLKSGAVDVIMPNVTRCGGVTGVLKINQLAQAYATKVALHGVGSAVMLATSLQLMSTFDNALLFEYNRFVNPLRDTLTTQPFDCNDGFLDVPTTPGWGGELDEAVVAKYTVAKHRAIA